MGASCVRLRPLRLTFTILLSVLAFTLFGLFSTLAFYNPVATAARTYRDAGQEWAMLENNYRGERITFRGTELYDTEEYTSGTLFTRAEAEALRERFGSSVIACFNYSSMSERSFGIVNAGAVGAQSLYSTTLTGFAEFGEDTSYWEELLLTDTDLTALGEDDIVITSYTFRSLRQAGLTGADGEAIPLENYGDIVGQTIELRGETSDDAVPFVVRGVLDIELPDEFTSANGGTDAQAQSERIAARDELLSYGVYAAGFVSPAFYDAHSADFRARDGSIRPSQYFSFELSGGALSIGAADGGAEGEDLDAPSALAYLPIRYGRSPAFAFFDEGTGSLRDEEIVLPFRSLLPQVQAMAEAERAAIAQREGEGAAQAFAADMARDLDFVAEGSHLFLEKDEGTGEILSSERVYADDAQMQAARDAVLELIERYEGTEYTLGRTYALRELLRAAGQAGADETFFTVGTPLAYDLESIHHTVEVLSGVFLALGVVMALLAMLLLFNFISVSILDKKREIGILRALGARSADVFKIFYSESAIIAGLCFLLSMLACFLVCAVLNATLAGVLRVSAFVFGPLSWLVMLGIALVTSLAATFLPVYGIAKRSPVESIRAL